MYFLFRCGGERDFAFASEDCCRCHVSCRAVLARIRRFLFLNEFRPLHTESKMSLVLTPGRFSFASSRNRRDRDLDFSRMRAAGQIFERGNGHRSRRALFGSRAETAGAEDRHIVVAIAFDVHGELPQVVHHGRLRLVTCCFGALTAIQSRRNGVRIDRDVVTEDS